jgi:hypothetical protein
MDPVYSSETIPDLPTAKASPYIFNYGPKYKTVFCINFAFFKRVGLEW